MACQQNAAPDIIGHETSAWPDFGDLDREFEDLRWEASVLAAEQQMPAAASLAAAVSGRDHVQMSRNPRIPHPGVAVESPAVACGCQI